MFFGWPAEWVLGPLPTGTFGSGFTRVRLHTFLVAGLNGCWSRLLIVTFDRAFSCVDFEAHTSDVAEFQLEGARASGGHGNDVGRRADAGRRPLRRRRPARRQGRQAIARQHRRQVRPPDAKSVTNRS